MDLRTCVSPEGRFVWGIHRPRFSVHNLRQGAAVSVLGTLEDGSPVENPANFPSGDVHVEAADSVFEIPNAFPFRGATYISRRFADDHAAHPEKIYIPAGPETSLVDFIRHLTGNRPLSRARMKDLYGRLPGAIQLAVAVASTDPMELVCLAEVSCRLVHDPDGADPTGLVWRKDLTGSLRPVVRNRPLFESVANNPHLPDAYKRAMVLRPGTQGASEIVGLWRCEQTGSGVLEYLRRNSYIPWGHYAANMADDTVRYSAQDLTANDMRGLRHLYYQRTYVRLAAELGLATPKTGRTLDAGELERMRTAIREELKKPAGARSRFNRTLWGWNYGFDCTPTGYRLNGSHQQIHQQYALVPDRMPALPAAHNADAFRSTFSCGDLVADFVRKYRRKTGLGFFDCYTAAVRNNRRTDERESGDQGLVVHADHRVMVFVPKAQTSQWELQILPLEPVGNILEADPGTRASLDRALHTGIRVLAAMGARMITAFEYAKRFDDPETDQRLLYCLLPRLPESPGTFSEAQLRWINRHYPEDFAAACRRRLPDTP